MSETKLQPLHLSLLKLLAEQGPAWPAQTVDEGYLTRELGISLNELETLAEELKEKRMVEVDKVWVGTRGCIGLRIENKGEAWLDVADLIANPYGHPDAWSAFVSRTIGAQDRGESPMLPGPHIKLFMDALLSGFDTSTLRIMVRCELDENLEAIAGGQNLSEVVFTLIDWAHRVGKLDALLDGALNTLPGNPKLQALAKKLRE